MDKRGWEDLHGLLLVLWGSKLYSQPNGRRSMRAMGMFLCRKNGIIVVVINNCDVCPNCPPLRSRSYFRSSSFLIRYSFALSDRDSDQCLGRIYGLLVMGQGKGGILTLSWGWCYTNWELVVYLLNHFVFILSLSRRNHQWPRSVASTDDNFIIKSPAQWLWTQNDLFVNIFRLQS